MNTLDALVKQRYTKEVQALLEQSLVSFTLANTTLISQMPDGKRINYPRPNYSSTAQYVKYTDMVDTEREYTEEFLEINKHPYTSFVIDVEDEQDIGWDMISGETTRNAYLLREEIDGDFFSEYANADNTNGAATALTIGASQNVTTTYGTAYATLANNGVDTGRIGVVVDPFQLQTIGSAALGNTFNVADASYKNGYTGGVFQGMKVFVSGNLTCDGALNIATNPTANDTVTINGVKFTFVATPTLAGDVDIGANAGASLDNLIAAVNWGAGAGTAYIALSDNVRNNKLRGLTATKVGTTMVLTSKRGYKPVSSSLTAAADKWGALTIHNIVMEQGAIHLVMRNEPRLVMEKVQKQLAQRFSTHARYGIKTFSDGAERMYDLRIVAQAAE